MQSANKAKTKLGLKALIVSAAILLIGFSTYKLLGDTNNGLPVVMVDGVSVDVEVVRSIEDRRLGLSDHESLPTNQGMFFVFEESGLHGFWMKDMDFSIDIIWIDEARKIVHVEPDVSPNTCLLYTSPSPRDATLSRMPSSA